MTDHNRDPDTFILGEISHNRQAITTYYSRMLKNWGWTVLGSHLLGTTLQVLALPDEEPKAIQLTVSLQWPPGTVIAFAPSPYPGALRPRGAEVTYTFAREGTKATMNLPMYPHSATKLLTNKEAEACQSKLNIPK